MSGQAVPTHTVWIPPLYRDLTAGMATVTVAGTSIRAVLDALEEQFPGLKARLCMDDELRPGIAVAVNGELARGIRQPLVTASELHFVPAIRGG